MLLNQTAFDIHSSCGEPRQQGDALTSTEYIAALASILLGLAIADLATSLHRLIRAGSKVRWHGLTIVFAAVILLSVVQFWWASYRTWTATESIGEFLLPMLQLLMLFLLASAALPDEAPDEGISLKDYYFETHRYSWALFAAYVASATAVGLFKGQVSVVNIIGFVLMCALAIWKAPWLHYLGLALISLVALNFFRLQIAA